MLVKELLNKLALVPVNVDVFVDADLEGGIVVGALVDVILDGPVRKPTVKLVGIYNQTPGDVDYLVRMLQSMPEEAEVYIQVDEGEVVDVEDIETEMVISEEPHLVVFGGVQED
jgi:hypothetical protein